MRVDFSLLVPEMLLAAVGFLVLIVDLVLPSDRRARRNAAAATVAVVGMAAVAALAIATQPDTQAGVASKAREVELIASMF